MEKERHQALVVGAGMAGTVASMELGLNGIDTLLLDAGVERPAGFFEPELRSQGRNLGLRLRALLHGHARLAASQ